MTRWTRTRCDVTRECCHHRSTCSRRILTDEAPEVHLRVVCAAGLPFPCGGRVRVHSARTGSVDWAGFMNELPWSWVYDPPARETVELSTHERVAWWAICNNEEVMW